MYQSLHLHYHCSDCTHFWLGVLCMVLSRLTFKDKNIYCGRVAYCIKIKHLLHLTLSTNTRLPVPGSTRYQFCNIYVIPKSRLSIFLKITAGTSCNLLIVFLQEKSGKVEILPFTHDCLQTWLWFDFDILLHGTSTIGSSKYCILGSKLKSFVVFGLEVVGWSADC